ncbi:MFS transporter [Brevibacterium album]|uniref:MFS transporter n=1 Tax=Brevibacterium album TaxID=417948 RepID=UPI00042646E9|nr:MFS transporter [Brevibacterium album]
MTGAEPPGTGRAAEPAPRLGGRYWRLLGASAAANLGDGLMSVAVVWLASSLTREPLWLTLIALATRLPWLLLSLPAGVLADRVDRCRLVALMDGARSLLVLAFTLFLLALRGPAPAPGPDAHADAAPGTLLLLTALCLLAFLVGCAEVLRDTTAQALMPSIVDHRLLERANGRLWGAETALGSFAGPALAGALAGIAAVVPFGAYAALLALAGALMLTPRGRGGQERSSEREDAPHPRSFRREIAEGFAWLWRHRLLRTLALLLGALNFLGMLTSALFVFFAQDVLGVTGGPAFGMLTTGMAAGALIGALTGDRVAEALREGTALRGSLLALGACYGLIGLLSHPGAVWAVSVAMGFAVVVWNIVTVSLRQRIIPDRLLGRVNSVYRFFGWGTMSLGAFAAGALVSLLEPGLGREWALRSTYLSAAVLTVPLLLWSWRQIGSARIDAARAAAA